MKYYLHYVASGKSGIYGKDVFKNEAKLIGVNRSLPYFIIDKLKWGDKILLANFESRHIGEKESEICKECSGTGNSDYLKEDGEQTHQTCEKCKGIGKVEISQKFQDGIAKVFGYFVIDGINITASNELKERLHKDLDIIRTDSKPLMIKRSCGSYVLECSNYVTNSMEDIVSKAHKLSIGMKEKVKYFVTGKFYELDTIIEGINFSRTVVTVDIPNIKDDEEFEFISSVGFIKDYNKRSYVPKSERVV